MQPYYDDRLNMMETVSLNVQIITIYFGLFFQAGKSDSIIREDGFKWFIFALVLIPSWLFLMIFIYRMRSEAINYASGTNSNILFKILSCGQFKSKEDFIKTRGKIKKFEDSETDDEDEEEEEDDRISKYRDYQAEEEDRSTYRNADSQRQLMDE